MPVQQPVFLPSDAIARLHYLSWLQMQYAEYLRSLMRQRSRAILDGLAARNVIPPPSTSICGDQRWHRAFVALHCARRC